LIEIGQDLAYFQLFFGKSKMAVAAILKHVMHIWLQTATLRPLHTHLNAKFGENRVNEQQVAASFMKFKMVAVNVLISVVNSGFERFLLGSIS
jgi:hypothetical protein